MDLTSREFHGIILPDKDPKNRGRYSVHMPVLAPLCCPKTGIMVVNHIHKWRNGPSDKYFYGEYKPLHPGTLVLIKFYENDLNSGYIDRIVSDQIEKSLPHIGVDKSNNEESGQGGDKWRGGDTKHSDIAQDDLKTIKDRDDFYLIYKTAKYHHSYMILEDTTDSDQGLDKVKNSIHRYYKEDKKKEPGHKYLKKDYSEVINENGIFLRTHGHLGLTIEKQRTVWIKEDSKVHVQGCNWVKVDKLHHEQVLNDYHLKIGGGSDGEQCIHCGTGFTGSHAGSDGSSEGKPGKGGRYYRESTKQSHVITNEESFHYSAKKHHTKCDDEIYEDGTKIYMNSGKAQKAKEADECFKDIEGEDELTEVKKIDWKHIPKEKVDMPEILLKK